MTIMFPFMRSDLNSASCAFAYSISVTYSFMSQMIPQTEKKGYRDSSRHPLNNAELFLLDVLSDIERDCNDDDDTLNDVVVVRVDTEELQNDLQKLEDKDTDQNA